MALNRPGQPAFEFNWLNILNHGSLVIFGAVYFAVGENENDEVLKASLRWDASKIIAAVQLSGKVLIVSGRLMTL